MSTVKRAIIMAAGMGNRLKPVTLEIPKPLIPVNGQRMIETIIHGLHTNDIREIYVVVGYRKEAFSFLEHEFPGLTLIENPWYDTCNNISSLYMAREHLEDAIILDGDQILSDPSILSPRFERSGYSCVWTDAPTREWLMTTDHNGIVTSCSRTGGSGGWQLYSLSRWKAEDAKRLKKHLELEFEEKQNRQIYWDDVALFCHPEEYHLGIYPIPPDSLLEIDNLQELAAADPSYLPLLEAKK